MVETVEPDVRGGFVDGVDDVVERAGEHVDVFAVERRDEGPVQALDDFVRQVVAGVFDVLDGVRLVPQRPVRREHLLQQHRARVNLFPQGDEVVIEAHLARDQSERHSVPSGAAC